MQSWTLIRFLHLAGLAFFVGGQLVLVAAVTPTLRRSGDDVAMRAIARRFGIGSAVALLLLLATGVAMASHYRLWSDSVLQLKLGVLVTVLVLTGLHIASPTTRGIPLAALAASLVVVYLGLKLTHG
jgi:putative copper export protein